MTQWTIYNENDLIDQVAKLPDWRIEEREIHAEFNFPNFRSAVAFLNLIFIEAECMNHHPGYQHSYKKIKFSFNTHDADGKITDLDIQIAAYISTMAKKFAV
jgi:4a-hydroxytetrahydrobiopterin dehydratase